MPRHGRTKPVIGPAARLDVGNPLTNKLIDAWVFNENGGTTWNVVRRIAAPLSGGARWLSDGLDAGVGSSGATGQSTAIDSGTYQLGLTDPQKFTLAWGCVCNYVGTISMVYDHETSSGENWYIGVGQVDLAGNFAMGLGSNSSAQGVQRWDNAVAAAGTPFDAVITNNGAASNGLAWVNGRLLGGPTHNEAITYTDVSAPNRLLNFNGPFSPLDYPFNGVVHYLYIWNRVLTDQEVRGFYAAGPYSIFRPHTFQTGPVGATTYSLTVSCTQGQTASVTPNAGKFLRPSADVATGTLARATAMSTWLRHARQKPPPGPLRINTGHNLGVGLIQAWLFNTVGGAPFDVAGFRRATLTGMTWASAAPYGACLQVVANGNQIDTGVVVSGASGTIVICFLPNSAFNDNTTRTIWGASTGSGVPELVGMKFSDNNLYFGWNAASDGRVTLAASATNWVQSAFQNYTLTWTPTGSVLYREGVQIGSSATAPPTGTPPTSTFTWANENGKGTPQSLATGAQIAYAYIYNRALAAREVVQLTSEPFVMFQTSPAQRWAAGATPTIPTAPVAVSRNFLRHTEQKPPAGPVTLDLRQPLTAGLVLAVLPGVTHQEDVVSSVGGLLLGGASWSGSTSDGPAATSNSTSTDGVTWPFTPLLASLASSNYSLLMEAQVTTYSLANNGFLFCIPVNTSWSGPFEAIGIYHGGSNTTGAVTIGAGDISTSTENTTPSGLLSPGDPPTRFGFTRAGTSLRVFRNGGLFSTHTMAANRIPYLGNGQNVVLLNHHAAAGQQGEGVQGTVAFCYLWNRTLTDAEMAAATTNPYAIFQARSLQRWSGTASGTAWTNQLGSTLNLYQAINETTPDDTTYVQSPWQPGSSFYTTRLGAPGSPPGVGNRVLHIRYFNDAYGGSMRYWFDLFQGSTLLQSFGPFSPQVVRTVLASDNFNRVNSSSLGGNWTAVTPGGFVTTWGVTSNTAVPNNTADDCQSYYTGISWPNDQYSSAQCSTSGSDGNQNVGVSVRASGTNEATDYYAYTLTADHHTTTTFNLLKWTAGTATTLASWVQPWTNGDTFELDVHGSVLTAFWNGTALGSYTDTSSPITSGSPGFVSLGSGSPLTTSADNWVGGGFSSVTAPGEQDLTVTATITDWTTPFDLRITATQLS